MKSNGICSRGGAMSDTGVLVLECIDKTDPGSEGRFLSHMFNLMDVKSQYVEIRTKAQLLTMLETSPYKTIHIITHGALTKEQFQGFRTPSGSVRLEAFPDDLLSDKTLVSTACKSLQQRALISITPSSLLTGSITRYSFSRFLSPALSKTTEMGTRTLMTSPSTSGPS